MGPLFQNFHNFRVFAMRTPENFEKWAYISRKIPKNGYLFFVAKITLKHGYGFRGSSGRPLSKPNLSNPPPPRGPIPPVRITIKFINNTHLKLLQEKFQVERQRIFDCTYDVMHF